MTQYQSLVTGVSSGIGYHLAEILCKNGHDVVGIARREQRLVEMGQRLDHFSGLKVDLEEPSQRQALIDKYLAEHGLPNYLILNAGVAHYGHLHKLSLDQIRQQVVVNLEAVLHLIHGFLPAMIEAKRGRIVVVSSVLSLGAIPYASTYVASKFAINGLVRGLRMDLKGTGVSISAMCPAGVATEFNQVATGDENNQRAGQEPVARVVQGIFNALDKDKAVVYPTFRSRMSGWMLSQGWLMETLLGSWQRPQFESMLPPDRT